MSYIGNERVGILCILLRTRMGINLDRFAPEAGYPLAITGDAKTVITLMIAIAIQQIDFA